MRIAIWNKEKSPEQVSLMEKALFPYKELLGFETTQLDVQTPEEALLKVEADAVLVALPDMPTGMSEGTALTAVLPRSHAQAVLQVRADALDMHQEFRISANATVASSHFMLAQQLRSYRPELKIRVVEANDLMKGITEAHFESSLVSLSPSVPEWFEAGTEQQIRFVLDAREVVPIAGSGVLALLTLRDDFATRTALKTIHHHPTSQCSNVERAFERAFAVGGNRKITAAHCTQDQMGNYHAHFCIFTTDGVIERKMLSQSTFVGMADAAIRWAESVGG
jgi:porphobilinogen deaminase